MANKKGSVKRGNRGMMAMSVGVPPPDPSWPPEMHLWHAVLVQGLMDLKQGRMFETESFELICDTLGLEPDYVRRKFNESLVEQNIRDALRAARKPAGGTEKTSRTDGTAESLRGGVPD